MAWTDKFGNEVPQSEAGLFEEDQQGNPNRPRFKGKIKITENKAWLKYMVENMKRIQNGEATEIYLNFSLFCERQVGSSKPQIAKNKKEYFYLRAEPSVYIGEANNNQSIDDKDFPAEDNSEEIPF